MDKLKKIFSSQRAIVITALILICLAFSVITPENFLQATTFTNIAKSAYYVAFMAIGVTFVICTGGMDLSIGTVAICTCLLYTSPSP